jgi:hypothetical protein
MPAHTSTPTTDHTGESLFGFGTVASEPDGAPAREYDNAGNGLSNATGQSYNEALGRVASSPTSGQADGRGKTPRGRAPGAPSAKNVKARD